VKEYADIMKRKGTLAPRCSVPSITYPSTRTLYLLLLQVLWFVVPTSTTTCLSIGISTCLPVCLPACLSACQYQLPSTCAAEWLSMMQLGPAIALESTQVLCDEMK
jgi:hypothetical protein